ncbi:MAG: dual specificity protein phosphatase family protein [Sulfuricurvum sp.]|nr:dual specificity protein phosphatase family protein [Sulfuricurvum sp.]
MYKRYLLVPIFALAGLYVWYVHFNYRFEVIDKNKVYKSAAIPPKELSAYLRKYNIKTVVDLRDGGSYSDLNPVNQSEIDAEARVIAKIANVEHINIPSPQVPTRETLTRFLTVINDKNAYPILIHCHHGTGRAQIYSAIYRIEMLKMANEEARAKTRWITEMPGYKSSFARTKEKGEFLALYHPSEQGPKSTRDTLHASLYGLTIQ